MKINKGEVTRPPRVILCGIEKVGKSTFASQFPKPLFVPIIGEEGVDSLDVDKTDAVMSFDDLIEIVGELYDGKLKYETLVIDSLSALQPIIYNEVCQKKEVKNIEDIGWAKGYEYALDYWRKLLEGLDALRSVGMTNIMIGHVTVRMFTDPMAESFDVYELDCHKKASAMLMRWADAILFASYKVVVKKEDGPKNRKMGIGTESGRVLYTQKRPAHPGGGRGVYGQLPYMLPLSYDAWATAITDSKKEE